MIRWLLDTDHVSLHERGHKVLLQRLLSVPPNQVAISAVTAEEMLRGRLALLARNRPDQSRVHAYNKLMETVRFINTIPVMPFDLASEKRFQDLRSRVSNVGSQDLRIAATALEQDLTLVTRNRKDFGRVPSLRIEDWTVTTPS